MTQIYSIEGHAFAGKTTLIDYLANTYGFNHIAEYDRYVSSTDEYPPHPHKTAAIAKLDVDFFIDLDLKREDHLKQYIATNNPIIIDRTFLSLILFQKYTKYLNRKNEYDSYDYAKKTYLELITTDSLSIPDFMIYLLPENLDVYNSRLTRKISSDILRSKDAYDFFNQQYSEIFKVYDKAKRLLALSSNNTQKNLEENALYIKEVAVKSLTVAERKYLVEEVFKII
jgi:deoxyadenosine/deoxycytidine kinase